MSEKTSDDEKVVSECECLQRSEKTGIICTVDLPVVLSIAGGIVGLVGGVAGLLSWLNQRKQTTILQGQLAVMREQLQSAKHQEGTATEWARKFDEAAEALSKISASRITTGPSTDIEAYGYVFKQDDLRRRIEIYLGRRKAWFYTFNPAILGKEQLQNPVVQQTIQDVLDTVAQFRKDHTDFARTLKLL